MPGQMKSALEGPLHIPADNLKKTAAPTDDELGRADELSPTTVLNRLDIQAARQTSTCRCGGVRQKERAATVSGRGPGSISVPYQVLVRMSEIVRPLFGFRMSMAEGLPPPVPVRYSNGECLSRMFDITSWIPMFLR